MSNTLPDRILIIGNSGSGKTTLAHAIAERRQYPLVVLDRIHWEDHGFARKRDEQIARRMTLEAAAAERWVMEGVYGWLAAEATQRVQMLIWLDLPWAECRAGLLDRKNGQPADPDLLQWAEQYWARQTSSSFTGHRRIYEGVSGDRLRLAQRKAVNELLEQL